MQVRIFFFARHHHIRGEHPTLRFIPEKCHPNDDNPKDLANRFKFDDLTKKCRVDPIRPREKEAG